MAPEDCFDGSGLFSRELGHTSMADHPALGHGLARVHLGVYGFLERQQLIVGEHAEKAL
jgi:hypothetical protein